MPLNLDPGRAGRRSTLSALGLVAALLLGPGLSLAAAPAATVEVAEGLVTAQRPGEEARFLGKDDPIFETDTLTTGRRAYTVIRFADGARMTLRPGTVFGVEKYAHGASEESALLRLFKGGLRALTGLIVQRNPDGYRVQTTTATIGIRGTDFDARLCAADCAQEAQGLGGEAQGVTPAVAGRVAVLQGSLSATAVGGVRRRLVQGGPVYPGDTLETGQEGYALIVFRDDSRVTLQARSRLAVEDYRYDAARPEAGNVLLRLVRGGVRALTGLIARSRPGAFQMQVQTATIGIRSTGFDALCDERCVIGRPAPGSRSGDGLYAYAWQGVIELRLPGGSLELAEDQAAHVASGTDLPSLMPKVPPFLRDNPVPRPDTVPVNLENLFGVVARARTEPGLYIWVRDGHVTLESGGRIVDLGRNEAGYADPLGLPPMRLETVPVLLQRDPYPPPGQVFPGAPRPTELFEPGDSECMVR